MTKVRGHGMDRLRLGRGVGAVIDYTKLQKSLKHLERQFVNYRGDKAGECLRLMEDFIADAIAACETMTGETWT